MDSQPVSKRWTFFSIPDKPRLVEYLLLRDLFLNISILYNTVEVPVHPKLTSQLYVPPSMFATRRRAVTVE